MSDEQEVHDLWCAMQDAENEQEAYDCWVAMQEAQA